MIQKRFHSILAGVLAAVMVLISIPMEAKAANANLIRNAELTASTVEENAATLAADKAGDGDTTTRWSGVSLTSTEAGKAEWLKATFEDVTEIKQIKVKFHTRNIDPTPNNVSSFSIKYKDANGEEKYAKENCKVAAEGDGFATDVSVILDETIKASEIQLCDFDVKIGSTQWNSVGVVEFEAYSEELSAGAVNSVAELVAKLEAIADGEVAADADKFELPEAPEGYTIELNGADFEQIIGDDLSVVHPLTDKEVQVSYKVSDGVDTEITNDITYVVKGTKTQAEGMNAKPVIIPEIQEWYSDSTEKVAVADLTKVTYDDDALEAIVDEFIADYADFTGVELEKVKGSAKAGAFNFTKKAPDALLGEEGYTMDILADRINVASVSVTGNMYGMQTILQMYKQDAEGYAIGFMRDYPRFEVRGLLLDIARKPIAMEMNRDIARTMRYYKMNDFQLHLSDNYIFLENYGQNATENEAFKAYEAYRLECDVTNEAGESPTAKDYYITKAEMRDFIQEQRALGMNIVPEIDMPAHATSFTKIWPELMVVNKVSPLNNRRPLVDHLDVSQKAAVDKIKEIFDDYTTGENPTFDAETIVHVGADEFVANYTAYREFVNEIIPHVKKTNTVRMWGGLTWIDDGKTEIVTDAIEDVEMNLWSSDWADGVQMYNMGYKLINTIDDYGYMVPSGGMGRANAYGDLLNVNRIFNSFEPNRVKTRSGYVSLPSGDDQMLGAVYAIWSDNIDKHASGLSESDLYWRFFDALPFYAETTWAATGHEKESADALATLAQEQGTGPNTNPYYQEARTGNVYESYDFEKGLEDTSENDRDLTAGTAEVKNGVLTLSGDNSYVTSPIDKLGNGNELIFDITLTEEAQPGDIIFETTPEYGTHDIRIMEDGKLGFTRELYNYYFNYKLPVGEKVNIRIYAEQQTTTLFVNGKMVGTAVGKFIHNDIEKKTGITYSTFALPLERIGSETNAISAVIDNVVVKVNTDPKPDDATNDLPVDGIKVTAGSLEPSEGSLEALLDGDPNSFYHSNWSGTRPTADDFWITLELPEVTEVSGLRYLPRQSSANGRILSYIISYSLDGEEWTEAAVGDWADNGSWKLADFGENVEAKYVKIFAVDSKADASGRHLTGAELRLVKAKEEAPDVPDVPPVEETGVERLFGDSRYDTGYAVADALKEALGVEKFEAVVVATGKNFADALAGSYLAVEKNAPILLTNGKDDNIAELHAYIAANVAEGGKVYILGGEGAVPVAVDTIKGYDVVRLFGDSRYDTNLEILKEAGVTGDSIIVATGKTFADSLSASAAKLPILLVKPNAALNDAQETILTGMKNIYIVGGEGAVSADYEAELAEFGEVTRVFGDSRYDTSVEVAKTFCKDVDFAVVASGKNFPDGLCGGPLAAAMNAPLVLTKDGGAAAAAAYVAEKVITSGYVLGGDGALANETVVEVFSLESADEIK